MLKRYFQIVCDECGDTIDNIEPHNKATYQEIKSRGVIISKGKHFCSKKCKEDSAQCLCKKDKMEKRICNYCKKPMGNSWHTETGVGELEIYVHIKCSEKWRKKANTKHS